MIEVEVNSVRVSLTNQQRMVVLKDMHAERYLPIWIGQFEAEAITMQLQEVEQKRPLTHDLLKSTILAMGGTVRHILINDLRNDIFYARLVIELGGRLIEVDSRPSDAIALAVRVKCPIFVSEAVMDKSAVEPEDDLTLDEDNEPTPPRAAKPLPETSEADKVDTSKLSAFADFLDTLDLDDLDKDS
ncbi:MAG: bifunctional nuclease family protein [Anaerolineae bacterium]|nr:bifunctional nuclease family protein [Anaerolineae bacterium]MDW8173942.1 bifunctional nuclease family protein [Anaerolineae bacterium]